MYWMTPPTLTAATSYVPKNMTVIHPRPVGSVSCGHSAVTADSGTTCAGAAGAGGVITQTTRDLTARTSSADGRRGGATSLGAFHHRGAG